MTPERWRQITGVFQGALSVSPEARRAHLEQVCEGDDSLRAEVEAMLAAHGAAGASDASLGVSIVSVSQPMAPLDAGASIGPYRVSTLLGAGGMGRVYRARDTRIGRDVAVKVLPAAYASDGDRLRRFEREARACGALNHPNVLMLFDVGVSDGRPYLVTELLDGATLRDVIEGGALPATRACELGAAIAHGLAAAHAKGIVHRDLKPENVMVTRTGHVKILDFGIAKLRATERGEDEHAADTTEYTAPDTVLGTAGYMAPEQVRGHHVDQRADIFALGAILYEMLAGRRAFERQTRVETLAATLHDAPPALSSTIAGLSSTLDGIVHRCLEKDPEVRFQSARDLAFALETGSTLGHPSAVRDAPVSMTTAGIRRRRALHKAGIALALLVACVAGAGLAAWRLRSGAAVAASGVPLSRSMVQFPLFPPAGYRIYGLPPAISPDGNLIAFAATPDGLLNRLILRRLDQGSDVELPGTTGAGHVFFSPDGTALGFGTTNALKAISVVGGQPTVICDVRGFTGGTWMRDGSIIFASVLHGLQRVPARGGTPEPFVTLDKASGEIDHHAPRSLPGDRGVLFTVHQGPRQFRIDAFITATRQRKTLIEDAFDPRYLSTGHLVYGTPAGLFAVAFDADRLEVTGTPARLIDAATTPGDGSADIALAENGTLVFFPPRPPVPRRLVWADRTGMLTPIDIEARPYSTPRLSPDGRRLAVVVSEAGRDDIWVHDFATKTMAPVTFDGASRSPLWSLDGQRLVYRSDRSGQSHLMWQPADASVSATSLLSSKNDLIPTGWSADGRSIVYMDDPPTGISVTRRLLVDTRDTELLDTPERSRFQAVSPNGRWVAYSLGVYRYPLGINSFAGPGPRRQLVEGGMEPAWSADGHELFFRSTAGDELFTIPFDPQRGVATGPPKQLFRARMSKVGAYGAPGYAPSTDGKRFLLVMNADAENTTGMNVLLHVDDELRRRGR